MKDKLIGSALWALSFLIVWVESRLYFDGVGFASKIAKALFGPIKPFSHDWRETLIVVTISLILPFSFALLNSHFLTKFAGKMRSSFCYGFAVASLWWVFTAYLCGSAAFQLLSSHNSSNLLSALPAVLVLCAAFLQLKTALEVAKENLQQFKIINQLSAEDKKTFETVLHQLKQAQNKDECARYATRCVQILSLDENRASCTDDFHALTKELSKQNRKNDAEGISAHYIALIEPTLLP